MQMQEQNLMLTLLQAEIRHGRSGALSAKQFLLKLLNDQEPYCPFPTAAGIESPLLDVGADIRGVSTHLREICRELKNLTTEIRLIRECITTKSLVPASKPRPPASSPENVKIWPAMKGVTMP